MRRFLPVLATLSSSFVAHAATEPTRATPLESRVESQALVQKLLREGKIMRSRDAKRGMRGVAYSVFQGTKIEKFNVEILGSLERVMGGGDLVMIRVLDGPVVKRQSGIIQGMSGSPVYVNGKLLGAIAIGFGFPKEPIGGVTPITQMIEATLPDNSKPKLPVKIAGGFVDETYRAKSPIRVANRLVSQVDVSLNPRKAAFSGSPLSSTMTMRPCTRLILLSGVSPNNIGRWNRMFAPYGLTPMISGGMMSSAMRAQVFGPSSKKSNVKANLAPGAAIGVQLASGDIDATGIGTVTYRLGNRVLAFGHPMFGLGSVSMPMTTAYVHDIFPSYEISFKLASPIQSVGELQQDSAFAVGGTIGRRAQTIPLRIHIQDPAKKINRRFNVRLIKDPLFTPELLTSILSEAVQTTLGLDSNKTIKTSLNLKLSNGPDIRRFNTSYAGDVVIASALSEVLDTLSLTQQNPFEKGTLAGLDFNVEVVPGRSTARIRRIFADRNRVKAGESVIVSVELEPTGKPDEIVTQRFTVPVPADAPRGVLRVAVSPAELYWAARSRVGGAPPRPNNLRELIGAYEKVGASNVLVLQASTPEQFLLIDRKKVANPPALWNRLVPATPSSSLGSFNEVVEQRQNSEWVLSGLETLSLPVESTRASDRQRPEAATSGDGGTTGSNPNASSGDAAAAIESIIDDPLTPLSSSTKDVSFARARRLLEGDFRVPFASVRAFDEMFGVALESANRAQTTPAARAEVVAPKVATPVGTPTPTPATTPTPVPTPDASANAIARPAGRWIQKSAADFRRGRFEGTLVRDDGTLAPGPAQSLVASSGEPVAWSLAAAPDGTIYAGTGYSGRLLEIKNGVSSVLYEGPEVAVSALALDGEGNLYAGVSPGGRVYRFAPDGTKTTILQSGETFVHVLKIRGNELLVGTGGERGRLYRVPLRGETEVNRKPFAILPMKHLRSLAVRGEEIFAGGADEAVLARIGSDGTVSALFQATVGAINSTNAPEISGGSSGPTVVIITPGGGAPSQGQSSPIFSDGGGSFGGSGISGNEITAVAATPDGTYFGTLGNGAVSRWTAARGVETVWSGSGRSIYALEATATGEVLAATDGGEVWRLTPDGTETRAARVLDAPQPQVLSLASSGNRVFAGTANNAAIYEIGAATGGATYTSNVFDAGQLVRWGALRTLGEGATIETRTGNLLEPDATWNAWTPLQDGQIASPAARYLQYRARLGESGTVSRVEALFRAPNRAPRAAWTFPLGGDFVSGKKTLTWTATDPDSDVVRSVVELQKPDGSFTALETKAGQTNLEWDSTTVPDGTYRVRLNTSDAARNPEDPLRDVALSLPFTVDNTKPTIQNARAEAGEGGWTLRATGSDASPLAGAEWRTVVAETTPASSTPTASSTKDAKAPAATIKPVATPTTPQWQAMASLDGVFDQKTESLVARLEDSPGAPRLAANQKIEVRLRDAAGNASTTTVVLP